MSTAKKKGAMGALLKKSTRAEEAAQAGRFNDLAARVKRTDGVLGAGKEERSQGSHLKPGQQAGREVFRQTVSLPPEDHERFRGIVARLERAGLYSVPLSAVARAALRLLADLTDQQLVAVVRETPPVKAGRKPGAA